MGAAAAASSTAAAVLVSAAAAVAATAAAVAAAALVEHILDTLLKSERALHALGAVRLYCAAFVLRWLLPHPR